MGRPFSEQEKQEIKELIIQTGKVLFLKFGYKKTSIEDIVKELSISKGSFYSFFESKEVLYVEVIKKEELLFKEKLLNQPFMNSVKDPKKVIKGFLRFAFDEVETNKFWQDLICNSSQNISLKSKLLDKDRSYKFDYSWEVVLEQFQNWSKEKLIIDKDPELLARITKSLYYLTFFKRDIGTEYFDDVIDFLTETISDAMLRKD